MAFHKLFKDNNDINEKSVVGFASFAIMTIFGRVFFFKNSISFKGYLISPFDLLCLNIIQNQIFSQSIPAIRKILKE